MMSWNRYILIVDHHTSTHFRPFRVEGNGQGTAWRFSLDLTTVVNDALEIPMIAMTRIQTHDVHTGISQLVQHFHRVCLGSDSSNDRTVL